MSQAVLIRPGIFLGWGVTFVRDDDTILSTGNSLSLLKASTGSIIRKRYFYARLLSANFCRRPGKRSRRGSEYRQKRDENLGSDEAGSDSLNPAWR